MLEVLVMSGLIKGKVFCCYYVGVDGCGSDKDFIEKTVSGFKMADVRKALYAYSKLYVNIMSSIELQPHERTSDARKRCNTWLREWAKQKSGQAVQQDQSKPAVR